MKTLTKTLVMGIMMTTLATTVIAFYPGQPALKPMAYGKAPNPVPKPIVPFFNPGLGFLTTSLYQSLSAQTIAEMTGQPADDILNRIQIKGMARVLDFYSVDYSRFEEKVDIGITRIINKNYECGLISEAEQKTILDKIAKLPKPRAFNPQKTMIEKALQDRLEKAVAQKIISDQQAKQILEHKELEKNSGKKN